MRSHFFWGRNSDQRKMAWVSWDSVMASYSYGWLNIRSLVGFNLSLLLKLRWRFVHNDNMLWVRIIKHIDGQQGGFESSLSRIRGSSLWSRLIAATYRLINHQVIDPSVLKKHVGNGSSTRFWEDLWLDNQLLFSRFPRLYALENFKNVAISDRWNDVAWFWQWRREVRGGVEQTQLDGLQWIDNVGLPSAQLSTRWNKLVPRKVNILIWRVLLDRIPTRLNLYNRDIDTPDILCLICKLHTEHSTHLFIGCEVANLTWVAIGVWIELTPVDVQSVVGLFSWLDSLNFNSKKKNLIEAVFFTTI
ncbi:RNA-directed DNA polymerase, eukaryota, reverse transcriptase zinc-binding domain protein [Tanacetum coccineum]